MTRHPCECGAVYTRMEDVADCEMDHHGYSPRDVVALRRDAERYRWIRQKESDVSFMFKMDARGKPSGVLALEFLDHAIDAAIAAHPVLSERQSSVQTDHAGGPETKEKL